jgi:proline dehydrogenase
VLQTRLFRTTKDIQDLPDNSHIRLCIGIYVEPKEIAIRKKPEMKKKIVEFTEVLASKNHFVGVATHDKKTINEILELLEEIGIGPDLVEFQFLLGVPREKIQKKLLEKGFNVRYYVPFATHRKYATAYGKRRFIENPHMAIYIIRNLLSNRVIQILIIFCSLSFILLFLYLSGFFNI